MTTTERTVDQRRTLAHDAWATLPHGGHDRVLLQVQCGRSHHVAAVYDTPSGPVYAAPIRARSHGSQDRVDDQHGDHTIRHWYDLMTVEDSADDELPAWCDCGPRTLSRRAVLAWLAAHESRVVID